MQIITKEQTESFKNFIENHESFIIAGHKEPDGDCIASCMAASYILEHFNKPYLMVNAGPFKRSEIKKFQNEFKNEIPFMAKIDRDSCGLIMLDCGEYNRLGEIDGHLEDFDLFIIDHHKTSDSSGTNSIVDSTSPAASCIVQQLYEALVGELDKKAADILFFGLINDTGYFHFLDSDSSEVFMLASRLVKAGANPRKQYDDMTGGKPWNTRKLLGQMLNRAERKYNGKLIVVTETLEDTHKYGLEGRDSDSLYQLMLSVEGVEAVVFVRQETEHSCTLGFRSRDRIDVSEIAAKFGGGGHKNAAGGIVEGRIETIVPAICKHFAKVI